MNPIIAAIEQTQFQEGRHHFKVGDGVKVHLRVVEGDKERIQIFSGIVIAHRGYGINEMFTVRRVIQGEGVERIFPIHSPSIVKIEVDRESVPMRARLYYLRKRQGKSASKVKEKRFAPVVELASKI
jgi:large subunit ribosomal protein L19